MYKVCILTAGRGSRMGVLSNDLNKSLLPVNKKAVISHIIEKFESGVEFVIAVGYEGDKVREYISHAHPNITATFVDVDNFDGVGSGPGLSLMSCRSELCCPFVMFVADTIAEESVPKPNRNWIGLAPVSETKQYCTARVSNGLVVGLDDKVECDNKFAFMGCMGINDYSIFWDYLEKNKDKLINNELQISNGLQGLISKCNLFPEKFTWHDTGTKEGYYATRLTFEGVNSFCFDKLNEYIYDVGGTIVKYFNDESMVKNRCDRANDLGDLCPTISKQTKHFYSYRRIKGDTLYECMSPEITDNFLSWAKEYLWKSIDVDQTIFRQACFSFYVNKTQKRCSMFYEKYPEHNIDQENIVNGQKIPSLEYMLTKINWRRVALGIPVRFHGDLQFDNILKSGWLSSSRGDFKLLDWRQDFGGLTSCGDLYYELGKLYGGLTIPYHKIKSSKFDYKEDFSGVWYDFETSNMLNESKAIFEKFVTVHEYNLYKIKLIRALIFLNMAPLHENPFDKMLYHMGLYYFNECLIKNEY